MAKSKPLNFLQVLGLIVSILQAISNFLKTHSDTVDSSSSAVLSIKLDSTPSTDSNS